MLVKELSDTLCVLAGNLKTRGGFNPVRGGYRLILDLARSVRGLDAQRIGPSLSVWWKSDRCWPSTSRTTSPLTSTVLPNRRAGAQGRMVCSGCGRLCSVFGRFCGEKIIAQLYESVMLRCSRFGRGDRLCC